MKRTLCVGNLCVALLVTLGACRGSGGSDGITPPPGPFDLTLVGDASFQGPHGGQAIYVAVLDLADEVVAQEDGTISATLDPAFSFTISDLLANQGYEIHYWIDSNVGGGSVGVCDLPGIDHQWSVAFSSGQYITITSVHEAEIS